MLKVTKNVPLNLTMPIRGGDLEPLHRTPASAVVELTVTLLKTGLPKYFVLFPSVSFCLMGNL